MQPRIVDVVLFIVGLAACSATAVVGILRREQLFVGLGSASLFCLLYFANETFRRKP